MGKLPVDCLQTIYWQGLVQIPVGFYPAGYCLQTGKKPFEYQPPTGGYFCTGIVYGKFFNGKMVNESGGCIVNNTLDSIW